MSTISPSLQIGGVNGWKGKEGAVLGWQQTSAGLFKPAKFDFARLSGSASYVDENGLIQIEHRPNYPRFTYQDGKQCLMNEEARTNNITYSEQFDDAYWSKQNGTVTANTQVAPDGTTTSDTLTSDGGSVSADKSCVRRVNVLPSIGTYSRSIFMKKGNTRYGWISTLGASFKDDNGFIFDFDNEEIAVVFNAFGKVTNTKVVKYANGWYRFILIFNATATTGLDASFTAGMTKSPSTMTDHDSGDFVYLWGAQVEEGAYASSYIPTEGSAVTRAAESVEGLNLGNFLGDSQGGLYVDGQVFDASFGNFISINDNTSANRFVMGVNSLSQFQLDNRVSSAQTAIIAGGSVSDSTFFKFFGAYATNDFALYGDGSQIGTDTSGATFPASTIDTFKFDSGAASFPLRGLIHEIKVYNQRPANSQMETQTT